MKNHFKKMLKIGKLRFYVTWDYRLRNSQKRDSEQQNNLKKQIKGTLWQKREHKCEMCGKDIQKIGQCQMHHVISWYRVPHLQFDERNLMLTCPDCHRLIHNDPFLQVKQITQKCEELRIKPQEFYNV